MVRNVYTYDFDPEQMRLLVTRLLDTMNRVARDLSAFADRLEDIAEEGDE